MNSAHSFTEGMDVPKAKYEIVYNNDTGPMDESFWEWWEIHDTETEEIVCKCNTEEWAKKMLHLLTRLI